MKVTGLLINVLDNPGKVERITIEDKLDEYYRILKCDLIDIAVRKIGDREFDIVCDDEGLFVENALPSALTSGEEPEIMLVGNLFICSHDSNGQLVSISDDDILYILKNHIAYLVDVRDDHPFPVVKGVEYFVPVD